MTEAEKERAAVEPDYIPVSYEPVWLSSVEVVEMIMSVGRLCDSDDGKAVAFDMLLGLNDLVAAKHKLSHLTGRP